MKTLILSACTHKSSENPALALREYIESRNHTVEITDILKYAEDIADKLIKEGCMGRISPHGVNRLQYSSRQREKESNRLNKLLNNLLSARLEEHIDEFHPDVIISIHSFCLKMLNDIVMYRKKLDAPVIAVLQDFYPDNFISYNFVDAYITPDEGLKSTLANKGIDETKIYTYGIPVDMQFLNIIERKSALKQLSLDDETTLLITGENLSSHNIINIFQSIINSHTDVQIIALIKNSPKLERKLQDMLQGNPKKHYISSDHEKLPQFMSASDLLITSPNWLTISEAFIKSLPAALVSSVPLHDQKNMDYLLNDGAAIIIQDPQNAAKVVSSLFQNPESLKKMRSASKIKAKPDAGYNIADLMTGLHNKCM